MCEGQRSVFARLRVGRHLVPIYCLGVNHQEQSTTNLLTMKTSITIILLFGSVLPTSGRPGGRCTSDHGCWSQGQVGGGAPAPSSPAPPSPPSPGFRAPKTTSALSLEPRKTLPLTDREPSLGSALREVLLQSVPLQKLFRNIVKAKLLPAVRSGCIKLQQLRRRINKPGEFERLLGKLLHLEEIHYKC